MRIALMYRTTTAPWGGGNSFLRALKNVWRKAGIDVIEALDSDLDGVLINSSFKGASAGKPLTIDSVSQMVKIGHTGLIAKWLNRSRWIQSGERPPFVHRLDGVFRLYGRKANDPEDIAQLNINPKMDWTVYQSEYCRDSFKGEGADTSRSTVILNGVDTDLFTPTERLPDMKPFKLVSVSWSPSVNKGAADLVKAAQIPGIEATFIGNWPPGVDSGDVRVIPPQRHDVLARMLKEHHALFHMALNDPCSNAVMEGIATGLPVIYHPSGGTPEIVGNCGILGDDNLQRAVTELRDRYDEFRTRTLSRRVDVSIDRAANRYLKVFSNIGRILVTK